MRSRLSFSLVVVSAIVVGMLVAAIPASAQQAPQPPTNEQLMKLLAAQQDLVLTITKRVKEIEARHGHHDKKFVAVRKDLGEVQAELGRIAHRLDGAHTLAMQAKADAGEALAYVRARASAPAPTIPQRPGGPRTVAQDASVGSSATPSTPALASASRAVPVADRATPAELVADLKAISEAIERLARRISPAPSPESPPPSR